MTEDAAQARVGFYIVGVQKAGTTALDFFLRRHDAIEMAAGKEAHHFDNEKIDWRNPRSMQTRYFLLPFRRATSSKIPTSAKANGPQGKIGVSARIRRVPPTSWYSPFIVHMRGLVERGVYPFVPRVTVASGTGRAVSGKRVHEQPA
jgi:hypothetical protein